MRISWNRYSRVTSFVNVTVAPVMPSLYARNLRAKSFVARAGTCAYSSERQGIENTIQSGDRRWTVRCGGIRPGFPYLGTSPYRPPPLARNSSRFQNDTYRHQSVQKTPLQTIIYNLTETAEPCHEVTQRPNCEPQARGFQYS